MCGTITKCLSSMTEICREAAEKISDPSEQVSLFPCVAISVCKEGSFSVEDIL